ncbi:Acyl-CoA N-acyltransferase [Penicillium macrosclerotiorum]|uniref:Acyl-CoA N-acyltransferase n=1 Tax=Penicillium macrosclerotiorum TaxID=303699 RepID=UPI0025493094|nr:Acyl-CoA N-acyltransferase [Penicillium macrosclerotiorum]KAJ5666592.1 Acyl-CoA N-acyltransferase [Penicillium macrosclerotiorum]
MAFQPTLTTALQPPPGPAAQLVLPDSSSTLINPPVFNDAMIVRMHVFVDEQHCSADAEIDADDARSWQWVVYESSPPTSPRTPVAVIRLVPPPQPPHALLTHPSNPASQTLPEFDWAHEPCIKLTRVAVRADYRGRGLGRQLVETALVWAAEHSADIDEATAQQAARTQWSGPSAQWRGLVLVHAQADVEQMYHGLGFTTDESLGRWEEEGIEHVGMFRRVKLR